MNGQPGWRKGSWGYHGDDGKSYDGAGFVKEYGPTFTTGDTVGCCIDFQRQIVFYTKNGERLDVAFTNLMFDGMDEREKDNIYPTVGLHSIGELVHINFGKESFMFDIIEYCRPELVS